MADQPKPGARGIALLQATEIFLEGTCGCGRDRCTACSLHREVSEYLDIVMHRVAKATGGDAAAVPT